MNLKEEKTKLVSIYTKILTELDKYWTQDSTIPKVKELVEKRDELIARIEDINKLLDIKD